MSEIKDKVKDKVMGAKDKVMGAKDRVSSDTTTNRKDDLKKVELQEKAVEMKIPLQSIEKKNQ